MATIRPSIAEDVRVATLQAKVDEAVGCRGLARRCYGQASLPPFRAVQV